MQLNEINLISCYNKVHETAKSGFCTPDIFLKQFQYNEEVLTINLMNMCIINSEKIRPKYLWEMIHKIFDDNISKTNFDKDYREYLPFSFFIKNMPIDRFMKSDKPDFYIEVNNIVFDLEIRSVLLEDEAKLNKIGMMMFGRGKSESEFDDVVSHKYKKLDWKKYYKNYDGTNVILSPDYGYNEYIKMLIKAIIRKNDQIFAFQDNNEKWLLLDTENNIYISDDRMLMNIEREVMKISDGIRNLKYLFIINRQDNIFYKYDFKAKNLTNAST